MFSVTMKLCMITLRLIRLVSVMFIVEKIKYNLVEEQVEC